MFRLMYLYLVACVGTLVVTSASRAQIVVVDPYNNVRAVYAPSPYWGYYVNPYSSDLHGVADIGRAQADIIRSQGQFLINRAQAAQEWEKFRVAKLERRKKELEFNE